MRLNAEFFLIYNLQKIKAYFLSFLKNNFGDYQ